MNMNKTMRSVNSMTYAEHTPPNIHGSNWPFEGVITGQQMAAPKTKTVRCLFTGWSALYVMTHVLDADKQVEEGPEYAAEVEPQVYFAKKSRGKKKKPKTKKKTEPTKDEIVELIQIYGWDVPTAVMDLYNTSDLSRRLTSQSYLEEMGKRPCFKWFKGKKCNKIHCELYHPSSDADLEMKMGIMDHKIEIEALEGQPIEEEAKPKSRSIDEFPNRYFNQYRYQSTASFSGGQVVPLENGCRISQTFKFMMGEQRVNYHGLGRLFAPFDPDALDGLEPDEFLVSECGSILLSRSPLPMGLTEPWNIRTEVSDWRIPDNYCILDEALPGCVNHKTPCDRCWTARSRPLNERERQAAISLLAAVSNVLYRGGKAADLVKITNRALAMMKREHGRQEQDALILRVLVSGPDFIRAVMAMTGYHKNAEELRMESEIRLGLTRMARSWRSLHWWSTARVTLRTLFSSAVLATSATLSFSASALAGSLMSALPLGTKILATSGVATLAMAGLVPAAWAANRLATVYERGWTKTVYTDMLEDVRRNKSSPITFLAKKTLDRTVCFNTKKLNDAESKVDNSIFVKDTVEGDVKDEERIDVYGTWIPGTPGTLPSKVMQNLKAAITIRMGTKPEVDDAVVDDFVSYCSRLFEEIKLTVALPTREETEQYLKDNYGGQSEKMMEDYYGVPYDPKFGKCKMFVKDENYAKKKDDFKPRMIWSRDPWFVVNLGLYFKRLGKALKDYLRSVGVLYTSGETPDLVGEAAQDMDAKPFKFEADASNWDGSLSEFFLDLELEFIDKCIDKEPPCLGDIKKTWKDVVGYSHKGDESLVVSMNRCRRSGDLWTSVFNSLINYLLTSYTVHKQEPSADFSMLVMGDDNLVAVDCVLNSDLIVSTYKALGMKLELVERETLLSSTFCSGYFVPVNGKWRWANMPFRQLSKMGINCRKHHRKHFKSLLYGTAKGLICTAGHLPIFGSLLRAIISSAEDENIKPIRPPNFWKGRIQGGVVEYPHFDTYLWFCNKYDVSIDLVVEIEDWIEMNVSIDKFPLRLDHSLFADGFTVDMGLECDEDKDVFTFEDLMRWSAEEEYDKLRRAKRLGISPAMAGWIHGVEERNAGMSKSAPLVHMLLSTVSALNIELGIELHQYINSLLWRWQNGRPNRTYFCKRAQECVGRKPGIFGVESFFASLISIICVSFGFPLLETPQGKFFFYAKKSRKKKKKPKHKHAGLKKAVGNVMRAGGTAIGTYFGNPALGTTLGGALATITGMGDYKIHSNSLVSENVTFGCGTIVVKHREYIGNIYSSTGFSTTVYDINPGLYDTFPWLSVLARNYERYDIRGLGFEFVTTAGYLTTTQAQGVVVMATQYDPDAPSFVNRREMESYMYTTSGIVTEPQLHLVECDPKDRPLEEMYLRYGSVVEERFTDLGRLTVAVEGCPSSNVILGELWVTYDVHLLAPRLEAHGYSNAAYAVINNGLYDNTDKLGNIQTNVIGTLPITITNSGGGFDTISFPPVLDHGIYLVAIQWTGSSGTISLANSSYTNCQVLSVWRLGATSELFIPTSGATVTRCATLAYVQVTAKEASIRVNHPTLPPSGDFVDITVTQAGDPRAMSFEGMSYLESLGLRGVTVLHPPVSENRRVLDFGVEDEDEKKEDEESWERDFLSWRKRH